MSWKIFGSYEWFWERAATPPSTPLNSGRNLRSRSPPPVALRYRQHFAASTKLALDVDWKNRSGFFNLIQAGLSGTYNWTRGPFSHELTAFNLEFDRLLSTTATFDSITTANPALYVSMRNQFVLRRLRSHLHEPQRAPPFGRRPTSKKPAT